MDVMREISALRTRMRLMTLTWLGSVVVLVMAMGGADATANALMAEGDVWKIQTNNAASSLTPRLVMTGGSDQARLKVSNAHLELAQQTSTPATPAQGSLWWDSNTAQKRLKLYDGSSWIEPTGVINRVSSILTLTASTTSEQTLYSFTIPANTLGTSKSLALSLFGDRKNDAGGTRTITFRIKFGGSTLYQDVTATFADANNDRYPWNLNLTLANQNATNVQGLGGTFLIGPAGALAAVGIGDLGTDEIVAASPFVGVAGAIDTTANQTLEITIAHSSTVNGSLNDIRLLYGTLELK